MNVFRNVLLRSAKLACAKQESQVLVVVETPNTVRTSWFKVVSQLDLSHEKHVSLENLIYRCLQVSLIVNTDFVEAEKESDKIEFMTCNIVNSLI